MKNTNIANVLLPLLLVIFKGCPTTSDNTTTTAVQTISGLDPATDSEAYYSWFSSVPNFFEFYLGIAKYCAPSVPADFPGCIRFLSYNTARDVNAYKLIDSQNLAATIPSYWIKDIPLYIVMGGFCQRVTCGGVPQITDAYLMYGKKVNVVVLDYDCVSGDCTCQSGLLQSAATIACSFFKAVHNSKKVCEIAANLIATLIDQNYTKASLVNLVGHSLGAQICACIGLTLAGIGKKISSIKALDPGPSFIYLSEYGYGIASGQATCVTIFHTSAVSSTSNGDYDVYFYNAFYLPFCSKTSWAADNNYITQDMSPMNYFQIYCDKVKAYIICSHLLAYVYFSISINTYIPAYYCFNYPNAILTPRLCSSWATAEVGSICSEPVKGPYYAEIAVTESTRFDKC